MVAILGLIALFAALYVAAVAIDDLDAWLVSVGIAATMFSGHWGYMGVPVPVDRIALSAGIFVFAVKRWTGDDGWRIQIRGIHWLLMIVGAYALGSALAVGALSDSAAVSGLTDRLGFVPWLLFTISPLVFLTQRRRNILLATFVVLGAYLSLTSLLIVFGAEQLVVPHYINDPALGIHPGRARGPFLQATENGLALSACAIMSLVAASTWTPRWTRFSAGAVALVCAATVMFVLERSIWLGGTISILVIFLLFKEVRRLAAIVAIAVGVAVVAVLLLAPGLSESADARRLDQSSIWDRENTNAAALRMIEDRPLFGFGWHQFQAASSPYFQQDALRPLTGTDIVLHNVFLSNAVELGLIGATLWMVALAWTVACVLQTRGPPSHRAWKIGFIALAVEWFVVANFSPLTGPFIYPVLWTLAGIVLSSVQRVPQVAGLGGAEQHGQLGW